MKTTFILLAFAVLYILSGCASNYKAINPKQVQYSAHTMEDGINFSYRYDVLNESGNRKYAKREKKKDLKLVAVRFTNNTGKPVNLGDELIFEVGNSKVVPCSPLTVKNELKQGVAVYLLYLFLTPVNFFTTSTSSSNGYMMQDTKTYKIGYILGPGISIGNMIVSGTANARFYDELQMYNILNRTIASGETVYGLVGFKNIGYNPITVYLKQ